MNPSEKSPCIAVIGMACRFPGAQNPQEFWQNLIQAKESIEFLSDQEIIDLGLDPNIVNLPNYVNAVSRLQNIENFDAEFWGLSPREAEIIDPQQRLMLELAQEVFDDAAFDPKRFKGKVGVFGGVGKSSYMMNNIATVHEVNSSALGLQIALATDKSFACTRISYVYDLKGPSMSVDTACSTSLVAIHLACKSLLEYECDAALSGCAQVNVPHATGYRYSDEGIFSKDGHCRPFDAKAQGTIFGSGGATVLLKRLDDAISDGDQIYAVIRGTATVNDGGSKVGFIAPSFEGQRNTIMQAMTMADVEPETIGLFEAHGSGTAMGDVIEVSAITSAYQSKTDKKNYCAIGSVKSNIGHLETAAGMAGLSKTLLCLKNEKIPPTLNFTAPNPEIDFPNSPFFVNTQLRDWPTTPGQVRRAAVTSIGLGGTNAHAVLEESPPRAESSTSTREAQLFLLSAKKKSVLDKMSQNLAEFLKQNSALKLADVAYTLSKRMAFNCRRAFVLHKDDAQAENLQAFLLGETPSEVLNGSVPEHAPEICFMFPGQGAQYIHMAKGLYRSESVFRQNMDACFDILEPLLEQNLQSIIYPEPGQEEVAQGLLNQTAYTQPALFAVSYSLAKLWQSWGVMPASAMGHSAGEFVAACIAEVFSLQDGLKLMVARGRLMQSCETGAMVSVPMSERELSFYLNDKLHLGAVNGPHLCVASGTHAAAEILVSSLQRQGVEARKLHISHASHSPMMDGILEEFRAVCDSVKMHSPKLPLLSNLTGTWAAKNDMCCADYWVRHLRNAVRFSEGVETVLQNPQVVMLEVGPGQVLSSLVRQNSSAAERGIFSSMRHPREERCDDVVLQEALGQLWLLGLSFDEKAFYAGETRHKLSLPSYPFERKRHWVDARAVSQGSLQKAAEHFDDVAHWFYLPTWKQVHRDPVEVMLNEPQTWLIFADSCGISAQLSSRLEENGQRVVHVFPGEEFIQHNPTHFDIIPGEVDHYHQLIDSLDLPFKQIDRVLHLWNVSQVNSDPRSVGDSESIAESTFYSLLYLSQVLTQLEKPPRLDVVTSNACEVTGGDLLYPEKALALGPCRTLRVEQPNISCHYFDVDLRSAINLTGASHDNDDEAHTIIAKLLWRELLVGAPEDKELAIRGMNIWRQDFSAINLNSEGIAPIRLRDKACYLISGGLGGIGLTMAAYLSEQVQATLVLISRRDFPPREQWSGIKNSAQESVTAKQIAAIEAIEARGSQVQIVQADVTNREMMQSVVAEIKEQYGNIHGLIHSAGEVGKGLLSGKTRAQAEPVLSAKFRGLLILDEILQHEPLDFMILNSSLFALSGGVGQIDYTAANAFLDAYAHNKRMQGLAAISINWDAWNDVGMIVDMERSSTSEYQAEPNLSAPLAVNTLHPLLHKKIHSKAADVVFETELNSQRDWVLKEHQLAGQAVLPGTAYLEMMLAALEQVEKGKTFVLIDTVFSKLLHFDGQKSKNIRVLLNRKAGQWKIDIVVEDMTGQWQSHASAKAEETDVVARHEDFSQCQKNYPDEIAIDTDAENLGVAAMHFGRRWHNVRSNTIGGLGGLAQFSLAEDIAADCQDYRYHPALMDTAIGIIPTLNFIHRQNSGLDSVLEDGVDMYLPTHYQRIFAFKPLPSEIFALSEYVGDLAQSQETLSFNIRLFSLSGEELLRVEGFTVRRVSVQRIIAEMEVPGSKGLGPKGLGMKVLLKDNPVSPGIESKDGAEAFGRILRYGTTAQIAAMPGNLQDWFDYWNNFDLAEIFSATETTPLEEDDYVAPRNDFEEKIAAIWQEVIGVSQVGVHDNFFQLGGHSLYATQVVARLRQQHSVDIPMELLFKSPTVEGLALQFELALSREQLLSPTGAEGVEDDGEFETMVF